MKEITLKATLEATEIITDFVDAELTKYNCPKKPLYQVNVAIDELFSNIANYAYRPEIGEATIQVDVIEKPLSVEITFIDHGKPFNPLDIISPDTTLSLDEREVGGLGIFIVKKTMDNIEYEFKDGKNILKIKKTMI